MSEQYLGFYSSADQQVPEHDPPHDGPCIVCNEPLTVPLKTVSLMPVDGERSYFYRAHKSCYDASPARADEIAFQMIEGKVQ